jgi:hypothetical protein
MLPILNYLHLMENKIIEIIFFLIGIILLFLGNKWTSNYTNNLAKDDFKVFNLTGINGTLMEKGILHHTISFKVNNNLKEFAFYLKNGVSESINFSDFVEIGDRIIKPALSDTLFLIRKHKCYKYTFNTD